MQDVRNIHCKAAGYSKIFSGLIMEQSGGFSDDMKNFYLFLNFWMKGLICYPPSAQWPLGV